MTFIRSLTPTSFSEVSHSGFIRVFHELVKRSTSPQIESKQYTLSNLCGIVNALCALEDNRLKNYHPIIIPLPSTNHVKFYRQDSHKSLPEFPGRCVTALVRHTNEFLTAFDTYCLPQFLHPSGLLDFGASNPGRHRIACSRRQGGGRLGGLPFTI